MIVFPRSQVIESAPRPCNTARQQTLPIRAHLPVSSFRMRTIRPRPDTPARVPECDIDIAYGVRMTTRVRRPRGTPTEGSYYRLAPDVKQSIDDWSVQFDVPTWAVIEAMVRATKIGSDGIPEGWVLPVAVEPIAMFDVDHEEAAPRRRTA